MDEQEKIAHTPEINKSARVDNLSKDIRAATDFAKIKESLHFSAFFGTFSQVEEEKALLDMINEFMQEIRSAGSFEKRRILYIEKNDFVARLPETAGLRKKVQRMTIIPEFEEEKVLSRMIYEYMEDIKSADSFEEKNILYKEMNDFIAKFPDTVELKKKVNEITGTLKFVNEEN